MKKIIYIIALLCLICSFSLTTFAHSGGTDGSGGHYNHSTGEYHYHHGFPAHDHPNGICPYKNTTQSTNDTNSTTKIIVWAVIILCAAYFVLYIAINQNNKKNELLDILWYVWGIVTLIGIAALFNL